MKKTYSLHQIKLVNKTYDFQKKPFGMPQKKRSRRNASLFQPWHPRRLNTLASWIAAPSSEQARQLGVPHRPSKWGSPGAKPQCLKADHRCQRNLVRGVNQSDVKRKPKASCWTLLNYGCNLHLVNRFLEMKELVMKQQWILLQQHLPRTSRHQIPSKPHWYLAIICRNWLRTIHANQPC